MFYVNTNTGPANSDSLRLEILDVEELYTPKGPDGWQVSATLMLTTPPTGAVAYRMGPGELSPETLTLTVGGHPTAIGAATGGTVSEDDVAAVCRDVLEQVWAARATAVLAAVDAVRGNRHYLAT